MAVYLRELTIRFGNARASDGERLPLPVGSHVSAPREVADLLYQILGHEPAEVFSVLCLSIRNRIIGYAEITRGTLDTTVVHPREVFRAAFLANAASVCLAHNHPSGDATPSVDDDLLTVRLMACGELLGITVLDHIIVAEQGFFSYRESRRMETLRR